MYEITTMGAIGDGSPTAQGMATYQALENALRSGQLNDADEVILFYRASESPGGDRTLKQKQIKAAAFGAAVAAVVCVLALR
jgi:hypothetical protein